MIKIILGSILGLFLLIVAILAFTLFGCFRKKTPAKKNVETELERMFPGQFQVLNSNLKMLDVMAQYKGNKQAVIGDKADPDVQFLLDWYKGTESAGFDSTTVMAAHERAKKDVAEARELFKLLKAKGLGNISVGVIDSAAYIQVYGEPTPDFRKQTLEILKSVLDKKPGRAQTSIFIELLEPEEFHHRYQDIIPSTHWKTGAGMQGEQMILSLNFKLGAMNIPELMRHWEINTGAKRLRQAQDDAYETAHAWAEKNLPKPIFMSAGGYSSFETIVNDEPAIRFGYPYYDKDFTEEEKLYSGNEAKGYVVGVYYFDQKVFSKLRRQEEF
ncbi:MAG: hypothetical protein H7246_19265 [Phycisphaerae bacterium]|nr:hypothetical protein [Saprospiraceae bacterium]